MFARVRSATKVLFNKYLIVTNTITCGGLLAIGDGIVQNIEHMGESKAEKVVSAGKEGKPATWTYNWPRTRRMFAMGFILGPFNHGWYSLLDKVVKGSGVKVVIKKIACDQAVAAPFFCSAFFMGMGLMEGKSLDGCIEEVKDKFITVYMVDWCVWPPAQFINFYFLPTQARVVYVSTITLCWNAFLSWMKHRDLVRAEHHLIDSVPESVR
ncbi:mpv17-like protein 2 [Liolophura sinensis]|uniref:mpv17-like protein 2 n=1 Tax=Liolophura sinensis TaxID=3198878 RepID=UPI0031594228